MSYGTQTIIDGLDGVGKGVFAETIIEEIRKAGLKLLDIHPYWKKHREHPGLEELLDYNVIYLSEPTFYEPSGSIIRDELISKKNKGKYLAEEIAHAYALNRSILYEKIILPARKEGIHVLQSRSVVSSLTYQPLQAKLNKEKKITFNYVKNLPGNKKALNNPPTFLIIPTIKNIEEIMERLNNRDKKDNAIFENYEFQLKLKPLFESKRLRKLFEEKGTKIFYPDAGVSIDYSREQARNIWGKYIKNFLKI